MSKDYYYNKYASLQMDYNDLNAAYEQLSNSHTIMQNKMKLLQNNSNTLRTLKVGMFLGYNYKNFPHTINSENVMEKCKNQYENFASQIDKCNTEKSSELCNKMIDETLDCFVKSGFSL